jgi:hypothetical protein
MEEIESYGEISHHAVAAVTAHAKIVVAQNQVAEIQGFFYFQLATDLIRGITPLGFKIQHGVGRQRRANLRETEGRGDNESQ